MTSPPPPARRPNPSPAARSPWAGLTADRRRTGGRLLVAAVIAVLASMLMYVIMLNGQLRHDYETEHETLCFAFPTAEHCQ